MWLTCHPYSKHLETYLQDILFYFWKKNLGLAEIVFAAPHRLKQKRLVTWPVKTPAT